MEVLHLVSVVKNYMYIFNLFLLRVPLVILSYCYIILNIVVFWKLGKPWRVKYRQAAVCSAGCQRGPAVYQNPLKSLLEQNEQNLVQFTSGKENSVVRSFGDKE